MVLRKKKYYAVSEFSRVEKDFEVGLDKEVIEITVSNAGFTMLCEINC